MPVSWGQNSSEAALPKRYNNKAAALGNVRGQAAKAAASHTGVQQATASMGGLSLGAGGGAAAAPAAQPSAMSALTSAFGSWSPFKGGKRRSSKRRSSKRRSSKRRSSKRRSTKRRSSRRRRSLRGGADPNVQKTKQFCVSLRGPDYEALPAEWEDMNLAQMANADMQRVRAEVHTPEAAAQVVEWFRRRHQDEDEDEDFISIRHVQGSTYELTYKGDPDLAYMIDPDGGGNDPIEINGEDHIVVGKDCHPVAAQA